MLHPDRPDVSTSDSRASDNDSEARPRRRSIFSRENDDPCPYFYDAKLELKMYRGPGFENFHPVLGSMEGHQELCDAWDARQLKRDKNRRQSRFAFPLDNSAGGEGTVFTNAAIHQADGGRLDNHSPLQVDKKQEEYCLQQVLSVFPQVQHEFVRNLYRERHPGHAGATAQSEGIDALIAGVVIAEIAEMESYPKQKDLKRKHSSVVQDGDDTTIKWNRDIFKNETYYKEAILLLADEFARIPTHFINKTLREKGNLYDTFHLLAESEKTFNSTATKPYHRSKLGRVFLEKKYQRTFAEPRDAHQYVSVVNEFQAAKQHQYREEKRLKRQKADEEAEASNFVSHQLQGSLVDCQCCFNEVPINRVVNCENDETHFFCNKCIKMRAEEQIGSIKHEMMCMDISGCKAELSKEALARALPVKISDKLAEIQQLAEIKAAGLDGLEQCPFCDFQAICPPVDVDTTFSCLNPDCEKETCRKCKEVSHLPRSCEEARKEKGLTARHAIEEARSEAMIRSCPRCKVKIVKSAGCNKMTCTNCRAVMCYVCKKDITGRNYEHFGQGEAACPLQDSLADDRHQEEADRAEEAAIAAAKAQDADVNEDDLRIEAHKNRGLARDRAMTPQGQRYGIQGVHALPNLHLAGYGRHPFYAGLHGGEPRLEMGPQLNRFQEMLQDVQRQHEQFRGIIEGQQQQQQRAQQLYPFAPALDVPPMYGFGLRQNNAAPFIHAPARSLNGHGAPLFQAHQFFPVGQPGPVRNVMPGQNNGGLFNGRRDEGFAALMDFQGPPDLLNMLPRQFVQNNNYHPRPNGGGDNTERHPPLLFNNNFRHPPL